MAGMTGQELLKTVKAQYPKIIRMITSAFITDAELELLQLETGIFKYIDKPWDIDLLRASLHEAMNTFLITSTED
jgi:response regulator RpfG family c-di-GMP phosphodiesterase